MTPYELGLHITEYYERSKQDQKERLTLTWLGGYLNRVDQKKFPQLKDFLEKSDQTDQPEQPNTKEQTPEGILAKIKMYNDALGGSTN